MALVTVLQDAIQILIAAAREVNRFIKKTEAAEKS
jgi:hypothetical protein